MRWFLTFAVLATVGCKKAVDAPDSLEEIMVFGFVNIEDPASMEQLVLDLPALVTRNEEQLGFGFRVDSLSAADVLSAGVDADFEEIIGGLGAFEYRNDMDLVLDAVSHPHKDQLFENTISYTVEDDGNRACFLNRECPEYRFVATQVSQQPFLGEVTQTFDQHFVWVEHEEEDRIVCRVLAPDPVDISSALAAIDRQFGFFVMRPLPGGGVERVEAMWAEARLLGIDIPDGTLIDTLVGAMGTQAERVDDWIEGVTER